MDSVSKYGLLVVTIIHFSLPSFGYQNDNNKKTINVYVVNQRDSLDVNSPYNLMGRYIAQFLVENVNQNEDINFEIKQLETTGSLHTLISIENSEIPGIGIVQSDVLYHYLNGGHVNFPNPRKSSNIRAVSKLFKEWIFIYTDSIKFTEPKQFPLQSISEVNGGMIGSGHLVTTINIGTILQLPWNSYFTVLGYQENTNVQDTVVSVRVYSPGNELMKKKKEFLIFLDDGSSKILSNSYPNIYEPVNHNELITNEYLNEFIRIGKRTTVAVNAILIVHKDLDDQLVKLLDDHLLDPFKCDSSNSNVSDSIKSLRDTIKANITSINDSSYQSNISKNLPVKKHHYLVKKEIDKYSGFISKIITKEAIKVFAIVVALILILRYFLPVIKTIFKESIPLSLGYKLFISPAKKLFWILFWVVCANLLIAILVWSSEYYYSDQLLVDEKFIKDGIGGSFKWLFDYLTVQNSKIVIQSTMAMFWVGLLQLAYTVSFVAFTADLGIQLRRYFKNKIMRNHITIIGLNVLMQDIINELKSQGMHHFRLIGSQPINKVQLNKDLLKNYIETQNLQDDFKTANIKHAKSIIVLTDKEWAQAEDLTDVDLLVLKILNELKIYFKDIKERPRIVVEVLNYQNKKLAYEMCADEVICVRSFGKELLAHVATKPNLSKIFEELLLTTKANNEIYFDNIEKLGLPQALNNFSEIQDFYHSNFPNRIPLGVYKEGEMNIKLNPEGRIMLDANDSVIVLSKDKLTK